MLINLSPSKLSDYTRCPRCFWIGQNKGIKVPRGIFPSLPGGIDRIVKTYFDKYRGFLPLELAGKVPGVLMKDMAKLKRWRYWKTGPSCKFVEEQIELGGALDDCLEDGEYFVPIDNKTKGQKPKDNGAEYYQTQMDCYNLMLRENGYKTRDEAYLIYWYPEAIEEVGKIEFAVDIYKLECSADRAKELAIKVAECLRGPIPETQPECEFCQHILARANAGVIYEPKKEEKVS